jgi:hypothetical protein
LAQDLQLWALVSLAVGVIFWISDAYDLAFKICRFARRVNAKLQEFSPTLGSKKVLGIWTFMVCLPLMLSSLPVALAVLYLTKSIGLSVLAFSMIVGAALFSWAIWAIAPAIVETIRESLER